MRGSARRASSTAAELEQACAELSTTKDNLGASLAAKAVVEGELESLRQSEEVMLGGFTEVKVRESHLAEQLQQSEMRRAESAAELQV